MEVFFSTEIAEANFSLLSLEMHAPRLRAMRQGVKGLPAGDPEQFEALELYVSNYLTRATLAIPTADIAKLEQINMECHGLIAMIVAVTGENWDVIQLARPKLFPSLLEAEAVLDAGECLLPPEIIWRSMPS